MATSVLRTESLTSNIRAEARRHPEPCNGPAYDPIRVEVEISPRTRPFWLTPISAVRFAVVTMLGLLPSIVLYISTGRQLSQIESLRDIISPTMLLLFALIGLLPIVSHWLIKRTRLKN